MKLLIQSDDYGITEAVSCGIIKGIKDGVVQCTGMFTNMPSSKKAAEMIKDVDVCLGIDINFVAGKPVSDPSLIPSMVRPDGYFYTSRERRQLDKECESHDHVNYEEALIEARAQVEKFIELNGKKPEYLHGHAYGSPTTAKVMETLSQEYHIGIAHVMLDANKAKMAKSWYTVPFSLEQQIACDTKTFLTQDQGEILGHDMAAIISHCGYIDAPLFDVTSFTIIRTKDLEALTSDEMKQWIKDHHIELISYRDLDFNPARS